MTNLDGVRCMHYFPLSQRILVKNVRCEFIACESASSPWFKFKYFRRAHFLKWKAAFVKYTSSCNELLFLFFRIRELNEKIRDDEAIIHQINAELDDYQSERNQKFWELKRREQQIDTFLHTFSATKAEENEALSNLEDKIVKSLEQASQYIVSTNQTNDITVADKQNINTEQLADQLSFKSKELAKSESTANSLDGERQRLQRDLQKVEQLEGKISQVRERFFKSCL